MMIYVLMILMSCLVLQTCPMNTTQEICVENQFPMNSINYLNLCYMKYIEDHYILVRFTIGRSLNDTFDFYRFVLRSIDQSTSAHPILEAMTNFTKLIDLNNSLRLFNLETGEYEVCIEFQSESPQFIYQPRDGCISIIIGQVSHQSFRRTSTPLLITLASAIVIFFILGLVVQWGKKKRQERSEKEEEEGEEDRISSSKQQRENWIKNFFRRYIDQPRSSRIHEWARTQAFRHRVSTVEDDSEQRSLVRNWSKRFLPSTLSRQRVANSEPILTKTIIRMISANEHPAKTPNRVSFHLSHPEESTIF